MANQFTEIATAAFDKAGDALADIATNNVTLLNVLKEKKRVRPVAGGEQIRENLIYQGNGTYTRYSGDDTININPTRSIDAARFPFRQVAVSTRINGLEQLQVSDSESRILDLLGARLQGMEIDFINGMGGDVYSDGTANGGIQITGLQAQVSDTGTGTVGGINSSTETWWKNVVFDATTDGGAATTSSNIQSYMMSIYNLLIRNGDAPDVAFTDNSYYTMYWESLSAIARLGGSEFHIGPKNGEPLSFNSTKIYLDGGKGGSCPTKHMYFLNTKYIGLRHHVDRNFKQIGDDRYSINQDGMIKIYGFAGNITCSNRSLQGVLKE